MIKVGRLKSYNVQEASIILDLRPISVRKYIRNGSLAAVKVGTRYQITEKALQDFLKGRKVK